ncbi:MAG: 4Fe-4S binding protein, partial [Zavarzinia sp.]|nr:4Fe-4S binding protein [Zavarzinia sp.]
MGYMETVDLVRQHLIDPAVCFRCDACESVCPTGAISHEDNYVIDHERCDGCGTCVDNCPSGAADSWRWVRPDAIHDVAAQLAWTELPPEAMTAVPPPATGRAQGPIAPPGAAAPALHLFDAARPALATLLSNQRVAGAAADDEVRHLVLRFEHGAFPVLEGQTLGILPPGLDAHGHPHFARAYSVASARDGENPGQGDVALTVRRVTRDRAGAPMRGVASNYLCDLAPGATLQVTGPFGASFLMPGDPATRLVMICTGTGVAPMRGMIQRRSRLAASGPMLLFYGGRSRADLAYLPMLEAMGPGRLDLRLALSREPGQSRRHVQDLLPAEGARLAALLTDGRTCLYLCGLRGLETGVAEAFTRIGGGH